MVWTAETVQALVEEGRAEDRSLEFKRRLYRRDDEAKREWAKDVTAMANSAGGVIVLGVREEDGLAVEVVGVPAEGLDRELSRLMNVLQSWTAPRVGPNVGIAQVQTPDGKAVLVVEVDRSWARPHAVSKPNEHALMFWRRAGRENLPIGAEEVQELVRESQSLPSRLDVFHADRVAAVVAGELPFPLYMPHLSVLTVTPWSAMRPSPQHVHLDATWGRRLLAQARTSRYTLEGLCVIDTWDFDDEKPAAQQALLHRTGAVEFVSHHAFQQVTEDPEVLYVSMLNLEEGIVEHVKSAVEVLGGLGLAGAFSIGLTLLGTQGLRFFLDGGSHVRKVSRLRRPALHLPRLDVEAFPDAEEQAVARVLRPMFDVMAQAVGDHATRSFGPDGEWDIYRPRGQ